MPGPVVRHAFLRCLPRISDDRILPLPAAAVAVRDRSRLPRRARRAVERSLADPATRVLVPARARARCSPARARSRPAPGPRAIPARARALPRAPPSTDARRAGRRAGRRRSLVDAAARAGRRRATGATCACSGAQLSDRDAGLFTEALALANWHAAYAFSPRTGEATQRRRRPAGCAATRRPGTELFPRTDAAIIVGVTDADDRHAARLQRAVGGNRFSLLAGFVEPGESLEAAVIREVFEESGVRVVDRCTSGSQPWPFPASLMVGFRARVAGGHRDSRRPDGEEILDAALVLPRRAARAPRRRSCCPARPRSPAPSSRTGTAGRSPTAAAHGDVTPDELLAGLDPSSARGRDPARPGLHPRRGGHRQDPRDHPPDRLRGRHRRLRARAASSR